METAEPPDRLGEGRFDIGTLADIAVDEMGIATRIRRARPRRLCRRFPTPDVDLGDDDLGALLGKTLGGRAANAATATRDECNFSRQPRHDPSRKTTDDIERAPFRARQPIAERLWRASRRGRRTRLQDRASCRVPDSFLPSPTPCRFR